MSAPITIGPVPCANGWRDMRRALGMPYYVHVRGDVLRVYTAHDSAVIVRGACRAITVPDESRRMASVAAWRQP